MEKPTFDTRVTVLCDCTEKKNLAGDILDIHHSNEWIERYDIDPTGNVMVPDIRPLRTHAMMMDAFQQVAERNDERFVIILTSATQVTFLMTLIANNLMETKLEDYPVLDPAEIRVFDVYDNETVPMLAEDGFLRVSGFDTVNHLLLQDFLRLQQLNQPKGPRFELGDAPGKDVVREGCIEVDAPREDVEPDRVQVIGEAAAEVEQATEVIRQRKAEQKQE